MEGRDIMGFVDRLVGSERGRTMAQWPETQEFPMVCVPFLPLLVLTFYLITTYLLGEPGALGVLAKTFPPTPGNAPRLLDRAFPSAARPIAENWKPRRTWRPGERNTHDTQSSRTRDGGKVQWWWEQVQWGLNNAQGQFVVQNARKFETVRGAYPVRDDRHCRFGRQPGTCQLATGGAVTSILGAGSGSGAAKSRLQRDLNFVPCSRRSHPKRQ